jgi:hypothetical protein
MNTLYRIYTEDVHRDTIVRTVAARFQGFTVLTAQGYWDGTAESSVVVEIVGTAADRDNVHAAARAIKLHNSQQAVLVTESEIQGVLL